MVGILVSAAWATRVARTGHGTLCRWQPPTAGVWVEATWKGRSGLMPAPFPFAPRPVLPAVRERRPCLGVRRPSGSVRDPSLTSQEPDPHGHAGPRRLGDPRGGRRRPPSRAHGRRRAGHVLVRDLP